MASVNEQRQYDDKRTDDKKPLAKILSIMVNNECLNSKDICSFELTCRSAKKHWCNEDLWKSLVLIEWPHLAESYKTNGEESYFYIDCNKVMESKSIFCNPRLWLQVEAERIRNLPQWGWHMNISWSCNCYENVDLLVENLKERMVKETLYEYVTREIRSPATAHLFHGTLEWHKIHKVEMDDIAIVVSNALINRECDNENLHFGDLFDSNPGFTFKGYKALSYALSMNTSVKIVDFFVSGCEECFCDRCDRNLSCGAKDMSNGLILKALKYNKESRLKILKVCPSSFGSLTMKEWKRVKPKMYCPDYFG